MSSTAKNRIRAVRLNSDGVELLNQSLVAAWKQDPHIKKLTRESRAEIMGIAPATASRLLAGKGVDRATILLVFKNFGLEWSEQYLEQDLSDEVLALTPQPDPIQAQKPRKWIGIRLGVFFACILSYGIFTIVSLVKRDDHAAILSGMKSFQEGDYRSARKNLNVAYSAAANDDSAGKLASALRLSGDLEMQSGNFKGAKNDFVSALNIRRDLRQPNTFPALYEAKGCAEIGLKQFKEAEESLMFAHKGYAAFKDPFGVAMACRSLGRLFLEKGEFENAEKWFADCLSIVNDSRGKEIQTEVRGYWALISAHRGQIENARKELQGCLSYWRNQKHPRWVATTMLLSAKVEMIGNNPKLASKFGIESRELYAQVGDRAGTAAAEGVLRQSAL